MAHALQDALGRVPLAIIVGTDCPTLNADYVVQAACALRQHDVVLGPAEDGGYGLVGLRRPVPQLFEHMPWGSSSVAARTLARADQLGLTVQMLDPLWDVDTAADLQRFRDLPA